MRPSRYHPHETGPSRTGVQIDGSDNTQIYLPLPDNRLDEHPLLVRTRSNPAPVSASIGAAVSSVDPDLVA